MAQNSVKTDAGTVIGTEFEGYVRFSGIPFAAAPAGARRFRAPEPVTPWSEPLVADRFGPRAPQLASPMEIAVNGGPPPPTSEEGCLTLNVWTPAADGARRAVMVWIHGGAFLYGAGSSPWYDGSRFAVDHDVVLVSINYRLGVLGFTYLGDLDGADGGSGSLGVQDAAFALGWVARNISAFGGDPDNVTIFGESAGAMSVGTLLALPAARGLFRRAILQSGAASAVADLERARATTAELLEILALPRASVAQLQSLPVDQLLEAHGTLAARHAGDGLVAVPVADGTVLPRRPLEAVADGAAREIDLLIGTNLDEWQLFALNDRSFKATDESSLPAYLSRLGLDDPERAIATYRERLGDAPASAVRSAAVTDQVFRTPARALAEAQVVAGGRVHMYLFTWPSPLAGGFLGACHALELPFVFNTLDQPGAPQFVGPTPPRALASSMNAAWAAFARDGAPQLAEGAAWPRYEMAERSTMILDGVTRVESDPLAAERRLWSGN
jgi:para-nitrobenzyl esterase